MFILLFITASISYSSSLKSLPGGNAVAQLMIFAMVILTIFSLIILIYSYHFLQLQRSKEFGLYEILGFGKRKIIVVVFWELLFSFLTVFVVGTILGIAFAKFLFLIFVNIAGGTKFNLAINPDSIGLTSGIFLAFFLLLFLKGAVMIEKLSSMNLLKAESKGEREPKANWLLALLGLILIIIGYYMALTVKNPVKAIQLFFIAVLLVILGTYFFYTATTVWTLKWRKRRDSYYKPQNFITISSLLYRMKANAIGLANITILLTMAIVTMAVTVSLYFGTIQQVWQLHPSEGAITTTSGNEHAVVSPEEFLVKFDQVVKNANIKVSSVSTIQVADNILALRQNSLADKLKVGGNYSVATGKNSMQITMTTLDSLKSRGVKNLPNLAEHQVLMTGSKKIRALDWYGVDYQVKHIKKSNSLSEVPSYEYAYHFQIIFSTLKEMEEALAHYGKSPGGEEPTRTQILFNIAPSDEVAFRKASHKDPDIESGITFRTEVLKDTQMGLSGFIFIGFILGISFILGAALIIYYKQLSEGTQDRQSFKILQEVGLSQAEVKKTIKTQVRMIFFLPILVSIVHFGFAYNMIVKIENLFGVQDSSLLLEFSSLTIVSVAGLYWIIYKLTSRVYYRIVER